MYRIGLGYDVHALVPDRELWLGGIKVPHTLGLLGHSDADVLIHAICDAMLGAANLKDIGYHFPDTSSNFKNIDSKILLKECDRLIKEKSGINFADKSHILLIKFVVPWEITKIDSHIICALVEVSFAFNRIVIHSRWHHKEA